MIIWIDGVRGVGKSTAGLQLAELMDYDFEEVMDADAFWNRYTETICEIAEKRGIGPFLFLGGGMPQNNKRFLTFFRGEIEKRANATECFLIVVMGLFDQTSVDFLFNYLQGKGADILHFVLVAEKERISKRIENDLNERSKEATEDIERDAKFINDSFPDAIKIDTNRSDVKEIASDILSYIRMQCK